MFKCVSFDKRAEAVTYHILFDKRAQAVISAYKDILHSYKSKMAHLVCIPYMVNIF